MADMTFLALVLAGLFGLGLCLVVIAQPFGRPRPDLLAQLRHLDLEEALKREWREEQKTLFSSALAARVFAPLLAPLGGPTLGLAERGGLLSRVWLEHQLLAAGMDMTAEGFYGQKIVCALLGTGLAALVCALAYVADLAGLQWLIPGLLVGLLSGFLIPDLALGSEVAKRRERISAELPPILDLLTIALSSGQGETQALETVLGCCSGTLARELSRANLQASAGRLSRERALALVAEHAGHPELHAFVEALTLTSEQGFSLIERLRTQAGRLRESRLTELRREGGKSTVRMLFPMIAFLVPILFLLLAFPLFVELWGQ